MHRWTILGGWVVVGISAVLISYGCGTGEATCIELLNCEPVGGLAGGVGGIGGGGGGLPTGEDCMNGADDDGDGKVDCADSNCSKYECKPGAPDLWIGYYNITRLEFAENGKSTTCANGEPAMRAYAFPAAPHTCEPCSCENPMQEVTCTLPPLLCSGSKCDGINGTPIGPLEHCIDVDISGYCMMNGDMKPVDTCHTKGGNKIADSPWGEMIDLCEEPFVHSGGCEAGESCLPAGTMSGLCIIREGSYECPVGWQAMGFPLVAHRKYNDTRVCTDCSCQLGACEDGKYTIFDISTCFPFESQQKDIIPGSCVTLGAMFFGHSVLPVNGLATGCTVTKAAMPSGEVATEDTMTICCK